MDITEEFKEVLAAVRRAGVDYGLCGGFALAVYGIVRATEDVDLLVQESVVPEITSVLQAQGYLVEKTPMTFQNGRVIMHRLVKPDRNSEDFAVVDLLLVGELTRGAWDDRRVIESDFGPIVVVSPSGLIELKTLRASGQDLDDIKELRNVE
ncbi:hypothetical protein GC207_11685 [bacterium]|nr:hypothetical protein [bacterium]